MRSMTMIAACVLASIPLVALGPAAHADSSDVLGQAQRFLNRGDDSNNNSSAYERGRQDELRRQQADRDRHNYRRDEDQRLSRGDVDRDGYR